MNVNLNPTPHDKYLPFPSSPHSDLSTLHSHRASPAMKAAILIRTASITSQLPHPLIGSPAADLTSASGARFLRRSRSTKSCLHLDIHPSPTPLRRARSDTDLARSITPSRISSSARMAPPAEDLDEETEEMFLGSLDLWLSSSPAVAPEEAEYTGGGIGKGSKIGGGKGGGGDRGGGGENERLGDYYRKMLKADPGNPLLLRNYGRFLHEVEGDMEGAEDCYGRAILASPGDGEVLAMYGGLVWEAHRDSERAGGYFQRAVESSPDDSYVLGSYAKFLWDAEEEEEAGSTVSSSPPLVKAF